MSVPILSTPSSLAMARSPLFVTGKNNALAADSLDAMTLGVAIYSGAKAASVTNNYTLTKNYSINEVINFEISDLVRSEFYHDIDDITDVYGYSQSPLGEALWVRPTGSWTYSNNGTVPETFPFATGVTAAFLALDGWGTMLDLTNGPITEPILATPRDRQCLPSNYESLAIYNSIANELGSIRITWEGGQTALLPNIGGSTTPPDASTNNTQNLVIYAGVGPANLENNADLPADVKPSGQANGGVGSYYDVILLNDDDAPSEITRVRYYVICEPKYTPYQIAFINRFGVADFITFFKRSDERGTFTQDSYQKSIYNDGFTSPSNEIGKYQSFNVNSRNSLTLNTGFVDQNYDETIKDILMSEYVVVLIGSTWVSVVPDRGSIEYQKHVNQKLINYTLTFTYAFDERTLVR